MTSRRFGKKQLLPLTVIAGLGTLSSAAGPSGPQGVPDCAAGAIEHRFLCALDARPGERVLDLGFGPGVVAAAIAAGPQAALGDEVNQPLPGDHGRAGFWRTLLAFSGTSQERKKEPKLLFLRSMDLHGIPWIVAVERVKGIEPSS